MRTFATLAVLAAAVSAECFDNEDGNGRYCDGEYVQCNESCWMDWDQETDEEYEKCETWCWENDSPLEEFLENVSETLENTASAVMNPEEALEDMAHGVEDVMEDLECWWAERAPETTCAKWERRQAEEDCWQRQDGSQWNWEEEYCMSEEEALEWNRSQCQDDDWCTTEWVENEWGSYCEWSCGDNLLNLRTDLKISSNKPMLAFLERSAAGTVQKRSALRHILSANSQISVDLDLEELARLQQDAEMANWEVEETLTYFADDLSSVIDGWAPYLEEMAQEKKRQDEQFAQDLANLIGSSITIDGTSLGEIVEQMMNGEDEHMDEADWLMARRVSGARDVRSMFALDTVTPADAGMVGQFEEDFQPTNMNVEISVDSARINELIEQAMLTFSDAKEQAEDSLNYFLGEVNDLASDLEEELEDNGDYVMETVDEIGDFVKSTLMDEEATQVEFSLAQKTPKAKKQQQSTNYAKAAAGATFGAIALFSIAGLIANQKKSVRENEESLL